ncbi:MAG: phosphopantothenoylcysteine decarboxylase [Planctomycetaceae bacterium]|jgi:phosphopantothenoylcysteine decarboxylase/phosphopantothenate--cysteine ligase|nr:phosphopantothenoylcysteine decarboxylase [Planctomycetaceae bacterium]
MPTRQRILITSGPTREYLDPVRFLTNGSSGRMGAALAEVILERGELPVIVSGPVTLVYPDGAEIHRVVTTEEMLECCRRLFPDCNGIIGAAAPCDFKPEFFSEQKLSKSEENNGVVFRFVKTPDILATLGQIKRRDQWIIGFALETENGRDHALTKLKRKKCDFIILNNPQSIDSETALFQIFNTSGELCADLNCTKKAAVKELFTLIDKHCIFAAKEISSCTRSHKIYKS